MNRVCLLILFAFINLPIFAQKTFWASKVVAFSSEYVDKETTKENRAIQALGKPSKLPQVGYSVCAWQPMTQNNSINEEFIIVSFDTIMSVRQIAIAENFGQGAISHVDVFDENNNIHPIWINNTPPTNELGKMLNLILNQLTTFKVRSVRVSLNTSKVKGWNQIDAIAISQSEQPIKTSINLANNMPSQIVKENLGKNINSEFRELAPVIAPDGKTLYYTRWKHPANVGFAKKQDIWFSELQADKTWGPAKPFSEPINNSEHNAICAIYPDGKTLLLNNVYSSNGEMSKGISISRKTASGWGFPEQVAIVDFKNKSEYAEYSIAPNGRILLISAQLDETEGGKDLYVSFLQENNSWSKPVNLGKSVNTAEDEGMPFIAADSKTLYFSTKGFPGYGNNDLFVTRRLDESWTKWSEPQNLGPMINTPEWDGYFTISAVGDYGYFSSQEKSFGEEDIFKLKIPEAIKPEVVVQVSGGVYNSSDKKPVGAKVKVQSTSDADTVCVTFDPTTGDYKFMLPVKKKYTISASQKGYLSSSEILDFENEKDFHEVKKNLFLYPIAAGQKITLNSVFFEQSKYELLPASFQELNHIVATMRENPNMEIMLEGHTDNQGDWNENLKLSKQRVSEVKNYLVKNGIEEKRIQVQGYGSTRPVASNNSEEKRRLNRRVEFTIVKI